MKNYEEKMQSKGHKLRALEDEAKILRKEINDMEKLLKTLRSGRKWTDTKFAAVAARQKKEIEKLEKQLNDCFGNEDFETLFDESGTSGENNHSPKNTNNSPS